MSGEVKASGGVASSEAALGGELTSPAGPEPALNLPHLPHLPHLMVTTPATPTAHGRPEPTPPPSAESPGSGPSSGPSSVSSGNLQVIAITPGFQIGEYVVESELGRGAFGTVYGAIQPVIGKRVAIKVLALVHAVDPGMVARFVEEARAVNRIGHAHIVDIFSFGELPDGRRYFVMERLDGRALSAYLKERGRLEVDETLAILLPVARALDAAHAAGIAHRDLKPDNIFLGNADDGGFRTKLLDFGVAKLLHESGSAHATETGVTVGTPSYMAPEQCVGKGVDHRADVYAFGVLAYRMLTGRLPFDAESASMMMAKHIYEEPRPPREARADLSPAIADALMWMLRKDKAARPQSLAEAYGALEKAAHGSEGPAHTSGNRKVSSAANTGSRAIAQGAESQTVELAPRRGPMALVVAGLVVVVITVVAVIAIVRASSVKPGAPLDPIVVAPAPTPTPAPAPVPVAPPVAPAPVIAAPPPATVPVAEPAAAAHAAPVTHHPKHGAAPHGSPAKPAAPRPNDIEPWH